MKTRRVSELQRSRNEVATLDHANVNLEAKVKILSMEIAKWEEKCEKLNERYEALIGEIGAYRYADQLLRDIIKGKF